MAPVQGALSENERLVFELITKNDLNGLKAHMSQFGIKANIVDEHGMTPLSQAAYKGNFDICSYLLDLGADPNDSNHDQDYSVLHFAGLSGNSQLCQLLLEAGANPTVRNSVGRTPAEIAAFVGNYQAVASINNYIPFSDVQYFTKIHGLEKEPKLPPSLAPPLHKFIIHVNIHPVRVALKLQPKLTRHLPLVKSILEEMSSREMKKGTNEVIAFKLHYLSSIIVEIIKHLSPEKEAEGIELFIKKILKSKSGPDGYMELLIRECVREFPYRNSQLLVQMVTTLANKTDSPEALQVVSQAINGHHGFAAGGDEGTPPSCATCSEENPAKKCSKCRQVQYCDRECQRLHWFIHKKECNRSNNLEESLISSKMDSIKLSEESGSSIGSSSNDKISVQQNVKEGSDKVCDSVKSC